MASSTSRWNVWLPAGRAGHIARTADHRENADWLAAAVWVVLVVATALFWCAVVAAVLAMVKT